VHVCAERLGKTLHSKSTGGEHPQLKNQHVRAFNSATVRAGSPEQMKLHIDMQDGKTDSVDQMH